MEEHYLPPPHDSDTRPLSQPLSQGAPSGSANAPGSVNAPGTVRESRGTNGIDAANTSGAAIPPGPEYGGEELAAQRPVSSVFITVTFALAMVGWLISLIAQAVVAATIDNDLVRILWFGFLVQTFVNFRVFGVLVGLVTGYEYGMQISILGSLATGFAVLGVDRNIYSGASAQQATGAGWLIVAIVDLLWIVYFTSPQDSPLVQFVHSPRGPLPPRNRVTKIGRSTDAFAMGARPGSEAPGGSVRPSEGPFAPLDQRPVTASGHWSETGGRRTLGSIPGSEPREGSEAPGSPAAANVEVPGNEKLAQGAPKAPSTLPDREAKGRAKALFDYDGSTKDPNELAFKKGDILLIFDTSSKWWEAKTKNGRNGIAPSNYLEMLPPGAESIPKTP
ncbi:hypothetical protein HYPSUDRAFT_43508 [Hypholoma sublateritium FD-334 SS-4]|uniref:SH3 domain-containing protein n=1 Tax=Hypholoma sublateritium (strain FD-334 SS-4) TaxID=945553 RepID=A0A0D2NUC3_HYPSF|nr:hypothetical protein HYPSUDRAFT_43508 [Hypholoma sublateritium FD-334 SS-4]